MAELIAQLNDLFGGFKERAERVQRTLRGDDIAFVLVTSPSPPAIKEALYFAERLAEANMPRGAMVVNRFHLPPKRPEGITESDAARALYDAHIELEDDGAARVVQAHRDQVRLAALDAAHIDKLASATSGGPVVRVAELDTDVHDLVLLAQLSDVLMAGGVWKRGRGSKA